MTAYTPTVTGKDGADLVSGFGSETYLANTWSADNWLFDDTGFPAPKIPVNQIYEVTEISFADWEETPTTQDGGNVPSAFGSFYTANTWSSAVWAFSDTAIPTLIPAVAPVYETGPIDFEPWRVNEISMNGLEITLAESQGGVHYTGNTWSVNTWTFAETAWPNVTAAIAPVYETGAIDFEPWRANELIMNGQDITEADLIQTTFTGNTWSVEKWTFSDEQLPLPLFEPSPVYGVSAIHFDDWQFGQDKKEGAMLTLEQTKNKTTYINAGFRFDLYWSIREGQSFPIVITEIPQIELGEPLQSVKNFVFVEPSNLGTIPIGNEVYAVVDEPIKAAAVTGVAGQVVTHEYGGLKLPSPTGRTAVFMASAIEDRNAIGGYGSFLLAATASVASVGTARELANERTVQLKSDTGSNVNFYYVEQTMPDYDFLCNMEVPDGTAQIAVSASQVSAIKVKLFDGSIGSLPLVSVDHEYASPIHVMTLDGIFALVQIDKNKNLAEPTP